MKLVIIGLIIMFVLNSCKSTERKCDAYGSLNKKTNDRCV